MDASSDAPKGGTGEKIAWVTGRAIEWAKAQGRKTILVRVETSPEDVHGMHAAAGILTARGGMTSHAAVVARGMGKPAVCGAAELDIDVAAKQFKVGKTVVKEGDVISINGTTGEVVVGPVAVITPEPTGPFDTILGWADEFRRLRVRTNADLPHDAEVARKFGAEGIGLCRTEHMFFEESRILAMREMICADDEAGRDGGENHASSVPFHGCEPRDALVTFRSRSCARSKLGAISSALSTSVRAARTSPDWKYARASW